MLRTTSACLKTPHAFARLALAVGAAALMAACSTAAADDDASVADPRGTRAAAAFSRVIIPSGTTLHLTLHTAVASDTSQVEDAVAAELTHPLTIDGRTALPVGALVGGVVSGVDRSGRVKGRARLALDFTSVTSGGRRYPMTAEPYSRVASATKGEDATKIGIGAGAGAVIGGILGGKKGSVEGAAIGGGAGTGVVLATRGREVRLASGTSVLIQLTTPLTVRVAN
jgi:outer membrane lipoprotein SlyB